MESIHVGWMGEKMEDSEGGNVIGMSLPVAQSFDMAPGDKLRVSVENDINEGNFCNAVEVKPLKFDDWEMVDLNSVYIEENFLRQTLILNLNHSFPVWIHSGLPVWLECTPKHKSTSVSFLCLTNSTEMHVQPFIRSAKQDKMGSSLLRYRVVGTTSLEEHDVGRTVFVNPEEWDQMKRIGREKTNGGLIIWISSYCTGGTEELAEDINPSAILEVKTAPIPHKCAAIPKIYRVLYGWSLSSWIFVNRLTHYPVMIHELYITPVLPDSKLRIEDGSSTNEERRLQEFFRTNEGIDCLYNSFEAYVESSVSPVTLWDGAIVLVPFLKEVRPRDSSNQKLDETLLEHHALQEYYREYLTGMSDFYGTASSRSSDGEEEEELIASFDDKEMEAGESLVMTASHPLDIGEIDMYNSIKCTPVDTSLEESAATNDEPKNPVVTSPLSHIPILVTFRVTEVRGGSLDGHILPHLHSMMPFIIHKGLKSVYEFLKEDETQKTVSRLLYTDIHSGMKAQVTGICVELKKGGKGMELGGGSKPCLLEVDHLQVEKHSRLLWINGNGQQETAQEEKNGSSEETTQLLTEEECVKVIVDPIDKWYIQREDKNGDKFDLEEETIFEETKAKIVSSVMEQLALTPFHKNHPGREIFAALPITLSGPCGSGKSSVCLASARAIAKLSGVFVLRLNCKTLCNPSIKVATIQHVLSTLFLAASRYSPSMLIFDDLDVLCGAVGEEVGGESIYTERCVHFSEYFKDLMMNCIHSMQTGKRIAIISIVKSLSSLNMHLRQSFLFMNELQMPAFDFQYKIRYMSSLMDSYAKNDEYAFHSDVKNMEGLREIVNDTENYLIADYQDVTQLALTEARISLTMDSSKTGKTSIQLQHFKSAFQCYTPRISQDGSFFTSSVKLCDVGGMFKVKEKLINMLSIPLHYRVLSSSLLTSLQKGALLIGPSGCGKTYLAHALANHFRLHCISVKGPELLSKYIGMSEEAVRRTFERAKRVAPCLVFFDEIDALAPKRGRDTTGVTDRVVNQMLCYLDGVEDRKEVYVLAASARPDLVDAALMRPGRFDKICFCGIPTFEEKCDILAKCTMDFKNVTDDRIHRLAKKLPPLFTPADIQAVVQRVKSRYLQSTDETSSSDKFEFLLDFFEDNIGSILQEVRPTLSREDYKWSVELYKPYLTSSELQEFVGIIPPETRDRTRIVSSISGWEAPSRSGEESTSSGATDSKNGVETKFSIHQNIASLQRQKVVLQ